MKVRVKDISAEGLCLDITEDDVSLGDGAAGGAPIDFNTGSAVEARLRLSRQGPLIEINGDIKAEITLECARCLKKFSRRIESSFTNRLLLGSETESEKELTADEIEFTRFDGEELDTRDLVIEQLALEAPQRPLCRTDCKGLCPGCGLDLNSGPCECKGREGGLKESIDPRLSKLRDYKVK